MSNSAVINAISLSEYAASHPFSDGSTAFEKVLDYAEKLPEVDRLICLTDDPQLGESLPEKYRVTYREEWDVHSFLSVLLEECSESEHIFYFFGDTPLLDSSLTAKMYSDHNTYFAQYTFAEGYPCGLTPEIVKTEIVSSLIHLCGEGGGAVGRDSIFTVLQKDINAFEIETTLSPEDMRLVRALLACDTRRNYLLTRSVHDAGGTDADNVCRVINEQPRLLRTLPAYYYVQVSDRCPQSCSYCPYPRMNPDLMTGSRFMSPEDFRTIADRAADFSGDAVIGLGLWGEPAFNPGIADIIRYAAEKSGLSLLIETSGIGWKREVLEDAAGLKDVSWIVSLDSNDQQMYNRLRGDGFFEARETAETLVRLNPGKTWIQAVRMNENEPLLESFYHTWKETTEHVIIQKYDHFCGDLPERKVADLSPVNRYPCWHIKRDVTILVDGTVPLCREDLQGDFALGNILKEPIEEIWKRGEECYLQHLSRDYNRLCNACDEYYTYNF